MCSVHGALINSQRNLNKNGIYTAKFVETVQLIDV